MINNIKFMKLSTNAYTPTKADPDSAGYDLYATEDVTIQGGCSQKIDTDIAMAIPSGHVGYIFARSGLACKKGIRPANCVGVIDSSYRGNIGVVLYNDSNQNYDIKKGDRIAQLVIMEYPETSLFEVKELDKTERGKGGFGHSGK